MELHRGPDMAAEFQGWELQASRRTENRNLRGCECEVIDRTCSRPLLFRQSNPAEQILISRIGAEGIDSGISVEEYKSAVDSFTLVSLLKPIEAAFFVAGCGPVMCDIKRPVPLYLRRIQALEFLRERPHCSFVARRGERFAQLV